MTRVSDALSGQSGVETWLPKSIGAVMILLDQLDPTAALAGDLGIACDGATLATPPVAGSGGTRRALLYDVTATDDKASRIAISVASQKGWGLAGVIGLPGRAAEWAARLHGTVPPQLVPDGPLTTAGEVRVRLPVPKEVSVIDPNDPPRGSMYLYDDITPPTLDGSYKMTVSTDISLRRAPRNRAPIDRHFDVVGPRFRWTLHWSSTCIRRATAKARYEDALPQVVLARRTLPWERSIGNVVLFRGNSPPNGQVPWVALLLFEEGEYTLLQIRLWKMSCRGRSFEHSGARANILCDAIEADASLVDAILPGGGRAPALTHVRQVNVEDRELSAGSSDGFFSVVMCNRLPANGKKHRACLVSLEQRTDLVSRDSSAIRISGRVGIGRLALSTDRGRGRKHLPCAPNRAVAPSRRPRSCWEDHRKAARDHRLSCVRQSAGAAA